MKKTEAIAMLKDEFQQWETLIAHFNADQYSKEQPNILKETLIHLWAWQQHTVAGFTAAANAADLVRPVWPFVIVGDDEGDVDATNAWIAQTYYSKSWEQTYQDWKTGFLACIALAEQISEQDLEAIGKYHWMGNWPLMESIIGTCGHHKEHRELLQTPE